jgi:hypothetical protein
MGARRLVGCAVVAVPLVVRRERGSDERLEVHLQLRPHVIVRGATGPEPAAVVSIPLQRCPVSVASAVLVAAAEDTRMV